MSYEETELEMAQRHVAEGERHVRNQKRIIERLRELEADTGIAEELLVEFEAALGEHRTHLEHLEAETDEG